MHYNGCYIMMMMAAFWEDINTIQILSKYFG